MKPKASKNNGKNSCPPTPWGGDTTALPKGYYYTLLGLMPGGYQRHSLQVLLRLVLQAQGHQEGGKASEAATAAIRWLKRYLAGHFRKFSEQISAITETRIQSSAGLWLRCK